MNMLADKGMVALPIEDYDRFKELEKKDYDFEKRINKIRDEYNLKLEEYEDKHTICLKEDLDRRPIYNAVYTLNAKNPDIQKWIMDKIGFKSIKITKNGVYIDEVAYFKTDYMYLSLSWRTDILKEEIKGLKERRHKILKSLSLLNLIKSWWNLKKQRK